MIVNENKLKGLYIGLFTSSLGIILFRNEGRYLVLLLFALVALIGKKYRKIAISYLGITILFVLAFSYILTLCKITPGGKREMFSVPFQQTARYVRDYPDDVTQEEEDAIREVLHYSHLAKDYDPNMSDAVKWSFNENASKEEMIQYFKAWLSMFKRHPGVYIQATMNNYYAYFYPNGQTFDISSYALSEECMKRINNKMIPLELAFSYPEQLQSYRKQYEVLREEWSRFPLVSLFMIPATYTWIVMLLIFNAFRKKKLSSLIVTIVPAIIILINLLGPCNGYYCRYLYPVMVILPVVIAMNNTIKYERIKE